MTSTTVYGLAPDTSYQFMVLARNRLGDGLFSNVVDARTTGATDHVVPYAPSLCRATAGFKKVEPFVIFSLVMANIGRSSQFLCDRARTNRQYYGCMFDHHTCFVYTLCQVKCTNHTCNRLIVNKTVKQFNVSSRCDQFVTVQLC